MIKALIDATELLPGDEGLRVYISNWTYCSTFLSDPKLEVTPEFLTKLIKLELSGKNRVHMLHRLFSKLWSVSRESSWIDLLTMSEDYEARSNS